MFQKDDLSTVQQQSEEVERPENMSIPTSEQPTADALTLSEGVMTDERDLAYAPSVLDAELSNLPDIEDLGELSDGNGYMSDDEVDFGQEENVTMPEGECTEIEDNIGGAFNPDIPSDTDEGQMYDVSEPQIFPDVSENPQESERERVNRNIDGGLEGWEYCTPFQQYEVGINDVDEWLTSRFLHETDSIISNVLQEITQQRHVTGSSNAEQPKFSRLETVRAFLPKS